MSYWSYATDYVAPFAFQLGTKGYNLLYQGEGEGSGAAGKPGAKLDTLIEPISSCAALYLLVNKVDGTKIGSKDFRIQYYQHLQAYYRTMDGAGKDQLRTILTMTIDGSQCLYEVGSAEARAIARIQRIGILGLQMLQNAYPSGFTRNYIQVYINKSIKFYKANYPETSNDELFPQSFNQKLYEQIQAEIDAENSNGRDSSSLLVNESVDQIKDRAQCGQDKKRAGKVISYDNLIKGLWDEGEIEALSLDVEVAFKSKLKKNEKKFGTKCKEIEQKVSNQADFFKGKLSEDQQARYMPNLAGTSQADLSEVVVEKSS